MPSTAQGLIASSRVVRPEYLSAHPSARRYQTSLVSGATINLLANDPVFSFRTGSTAGTVYVIHRVQCSLHNILAFASAELNRIELVVARSFTASDSGGTAATLTGNHGKLRTDDATTTISDFRIADTAVLTAGTRTLDSQSIGMSSFLNSTTARSVLLGNAGLVNAASTGNNGPPLVLGINEGFIIRPAVSYPATGTIVCSISVTWFELSEW